VRSHKVLDPNTGTNGTREQRQGGLVNEEFQNQMVLGINILVLLLPGLVGQFCLPRLT
jgi:hypothetical protein